MVNRSSSEQVLDSVQTESSGSPPATEILCYKSCSFFGPGSFYRVGADRTWVGNTRPVPDLCEVARSGKMGLTNRLAPVPPCG